MKRCLKETFARGYALQVYIAQQTNFTLTLSQIHFKRLCGYNMGEWGHSSYGGGAGGGAQKTFYGPIDMVYWLPDLPAPQGRIQATPTNFCFKYACFFSGSIFACGHYGSASTWLRASFQPIQHKGLTQWAWLNFYLVNCYTWAGASCDKSRMGGFAN